MSYDESIQILIGDQNSLKNIGLIFEAWLDTTLEHIDTIYGIGTTKYNNFITLRSEYKISKITTKNLEETNNYFANRATQQLKGLIEQLKRERNSSVAKQKQEEEEKNKPNNKTFSEELKIPKQEQVDRKYYNIGITLFWAVTIPMFAGIFYFGYFVGTAKFDKEKNDYYDEIKNLKKSKSELIEQVKLKDSLVANYESITFASFNQPGEMPTLTIANSKIPCFAGSINGCWKQSILANPGDTIAIHLYYRNSSCVIAKETTLHISPMNSLPTSRIIFSGGVASKTGPRIVGEATLEISSRRAVVYIPNSARWNVSIDKNFTVDDESLFGKGFNIGTITPNTQGTLVAFFKVLNN